MKSLPILLIGAGFVTASFVMSERKPDPAAEFARQFVECSDLKGPAACEIYLDEWSKRPGARREIIERFAKDKAFALHLLAFGDAQIITGSIKK
ncbi:MAG: hypothetical protein Q8Q62_16815 [Mesorhizobium sp.]|nr:hypothetical protein [Mesorhizobium sp.]